MKNDIRKEKENMTLEFITDINFHSICLWYSPLIYGLSTIVLPEGHLEYLSYDTCLMKLQN